MLWTDKAKRILEKYWGFSNLKDKQIDVINELLLGKDVIGLLPTGYGKSMCYLIPSLVTKKAIIIISPLISLMDDQKEKLIKMNIPVSALHGNNKNKDKELFEIIDGNIKIIYMSPEYLIKGDGLELAESMIQNNLLGYLAIDESHCISVWGHDFRPEYLKIRLFREKFPQIPMIAVTATATQKVVEEISEFLNMNSPSIITANFDRPNLYLKCLEYKKDKVEKPKKKKNEPKPEKDKNNITDEISLDLLFPYFEKYKNDKIIIYTNSRQMSVNLSNEINKIHSQGRISEAYHAGMSKGMREKIQTKFSDGDIKIMVSTIAFGMGVDQIVRCVIIIGASSSIEEYWQQIGRAGRDNLEAETIVFYQFKSLAIAESMLKEIKNPKLRQNRKNNIYAVKNYLYLNTCRRRFVLDHFDQPPKFFTCNRCDNCCEKELTDITPIVWSIVYKEEIPIPNFDKNEIDFLKKNIKHPKFNMINNVFMELNLNTWKMYIDKKKYKYNILPENLKIKIYYQDLLNSHITNVTNIVEDIDEISKYEKLLKNINL
jgi:RecQ family ATP-dependent DNA helicase